MIIIRYLRDKMKLIPLLQVQTTINILLDACEGNFNNVLSGNSLMMKHDCLHLIGDFH